MDEGRGRGLKKKIIHSRGGHVAGSSELRHAKRELPAIRVLALGGADVLSQV